MATQTQHFNLTKPDWEDRASISVLNANTDIIDAQMYDNEQSAANAIGNMAAEYDDTATYEVGDFCIYSEVLYKCVTAVSVAEAFDSTKWTQTKAAENFGSGGGGGSATLAGLNDVDLTSPTNGQALVYDGANQKWVNGAGGGGNTLVIQNASIYSTDEQQVGVWVDGKPMYQKTFIFSNISTLTGNQNYQTDLSNVDEAFLEGEIIEGVNRYAIPWAGNSGYAIGFFFNTSTNYIYTKGIDTFSNATLKITVKYTKTTDAAGSGGYKAYGLSPIIFSEEEREVGVWTDGKPLYQKTVSFGALPNNTTKSVAHGIQNADFINPINVFAFYPNAQHNTSIPAFSLYNVANGIVVNVSDTNIEITARTDVSAYTNCYVTLLYTKTTDTAGSGTWTTTGEYAHHYSTSEHVIGTWIDGRPLYERTFQETIAGNTEVVLDTGIDFCMTMGLAYTQTNETLSPNYLDASTRVYCYVHTQYSNGVWTMRMQNNHSASLTWTAIVRYTKTTD